MSGGFYMLKKIGSMLLLVWLVLGTGAGVFAEGEALELETPHAILIEVSTGTVLYEKDADTPVHPASVTKVMTMLLIMEALDQGKLKLEDEVVTSAHAKSMGGSQVFLEEGENGLMEDFLPNNVDSSDFFNYGLNKEEFDKLIQESLIYHYENHLKEEKEKRDKMNMFMFNMNINMNMNNMGNNFIQRGMTTPMNYMNNMNNFLMNNMNYNNGINNDDNNNIINKNNSENKNEIMSDNDKKE